MKSFTILIEIGQKGINYWQICILCTFVRRSLFLYKFIEKQHKKILTLTRNALLNKYCVENIDTGFKASKFGK